MPQENFPNRPAAHQEATDAEAARVAAHLRVSPDDVHDRRSRAEQQRQMIQAYLGREDALQDLRDC